MNFQRVKALVRKELRKTARDPAALFMIILFPVLMTVMFGLSFGQVGGGGTTVYKVGVVDLNAEGQDHHWSDDLVHNLSRNGMLDLARYDSNGSAQDALAKGELAAVVVIPTDLGASIASFRQAPTNSSAWVNATVRVYSDKGSMVAVQAIPPMVQQALADTVAGGKASGPSLPVVVTGEAISDVSKLDVFDYVAPGLFAFGAIFMIMIVAGTLTTEREQGLLRRMSTTPLSASELLGAQAIAYMILATLQAAVIFGMAYAIGYHPVVGPASVVMAFIIVIIFSLCCVGFGLITAALARSSGAATGIAFIFIMPLMFLGTFVSSMAPTAVTNAAGAFVPSHYVTDALTFLFLRGASPLSGPVLFDLGVLAVASMIILVVGILLFRKTGRSG